MANFNISSLFFTEDQLESSYKKLFIDSNVKIKLIDIGHPLDYAYRSPRQITTIKTEHGSARQHLLTYDSAQNYYQSEKARIMCDPEWAEQVRLSENPYRDGFIPVEIYRHNVHKWKEYEYDVAFKCNWLKFTQNRSLAEELLRTGYRPIVARKCTGWADINAMILMIIRDDLREQGIDGRYIPRFY